MSRVLTCKCGCSQIEIHTKETVKAPKVLMRGLDTAQRLGQVEIAGEEGKQSPRPPTGSKTARSTVVSPLRTPRSRASVALEEKWHKTPEKKVSKGPDLWSAPIRRITSKCCRTILCVDQPHFGGRIIVRADSRGVIIEPVNLLCNPR